MNYYNNQQREIMREFFGIGIKRTPICNKCQHQKLGLTTICEKYKRIPSSIQEGGYCSKFLEVRE
ncbi:hypothetical protein [Tissierella pigra]|uniref:Uncharacterized protein n=1 Tax=Tissierella pigra TaxID=2607614 RepID=A0A6N7XZ90_9FIRM|nr:hypothetical protein [Tissierella pigra]MSU01884.1 hypothetical protein [Tissierella pigra]